MSIKHLIMDALLESWTFAENAKNYWESKDLVHAIHLNANANMLRDLAYALEESETKRVAVVGALEEEK